MRIPCFSRFPFRFHPAKLNLNSTLPIRIFVRNETHYDVLKVSRTCSSKEIREAFINLSKENHPDKHQNDPSMHSRFVKINDAYRTLSKPSSRRLYDLSIGVKRRLNSPDFTTNVYSTTATKQGFTKQYSHDEYQDFSNPYMWHNVKSSDKPNDNYYGIKGVKKVSNTVILWCLFAFTVVGVTLQVIIIKFSSARRNEFMKEESRKNSLLESMLKEKAKLYGNEHQIQVLKNSLKATYAFDDIGVTKIKDEKVVPVKDDIISPNTENIVEKPPPAKRMKQTTSVEQLVPDNIEYSNIAVPVYND